MKERELDYILVPFGVMVLCVYHVWLLFTIKRRPTRTVIGINAQSRHQWVFSMMSVCVSCISVLYVYMINHEYSFFYFLLFVCSFMIVHQELDKFYIVLMCGFS